ncbi:glycosyltransferase [candidate division WOR-3 bacterium]|nr:glycosyltransferase [candidate division WOR-3 bacterium]
MRVDQFIPGLYPGNSMAEDAIEIKKSLKNLGYASEIFSLEIASEVGSEGCFVKSYIPFKNSIIIYHLGEGSPLIDFFLELPERKILLYHNITPPEFFKDIHKQITTTGGIEDIKLFKDKIVLALADSEYSRQELKSLGFRKTGTLPIILNSDKYKTLKNNDSLIKKFKDDWENILFTGRLVPNKKVEDVIKVFYYYKKGINENTRLFLVGTYTNSPTYIAFLKSLISNLKLTDVYIPGYVDFTDFVAYYRISDIFISMSEHEGFGIPFLESMYFNIPIIAYNSTAIPYTIGDAGIIVNEKNYPKIAELINVILTDKDWRKEIIKKQRERLKEFSREKIEKKLKQYIEMVRKEELQIDTRFSQGKK